MNNNEWIIVTVMAVCLLILSAFIISFDAYQCKTKAVIQEMEWSYGPIQGCIVKQENGKWIDYDHLRYIDE